MKLDEKEFNEFLGTQPAKAATVVVEDKKASTSGSQNADKTKLDNVETPKEAPLVTASVDNAVEATRAAWEALSRPIFLKKNPTNKE